MTTGVNDDHWVKSWT